MDNHTSNSKSVSPNKECIRCGTCCEKGGPGLHQADRMLIDKGTIPARCLFTIRKGESAYDNVKGCLMPADADIIKIKGKQKSWACIFFAEPTKECSVYNDRPLECRTLKCWDTRELEDMYARHRLTRDDLIAEVEGLWELITNHQERCNYAQIQILIQDLASSHAKNARRKLAEIIQYDVEIRDLVVSKGGMDPDMLDFLFGRPLTKTLTNYGVNIRQQGRKITVTRNP